jgi:hypothetical protein
VRVSQKERAGKGSAGPFIKVHCKSSQDLNTKMA